MRTWVPGLAVFAALVLVSIVGAVAFLAAGQIALVLDPAADESHLDSFMVAIIGVAAAVACALPIFSRGVPWLTAHLQRIWPQRPPEHAVRSSSLRIERENEAARAVTLVHHRRDPGELDRDESEVAVDVDRKR